MDVVPTLIRCELISVLNTVTSAKTHLRIRSPGEVPDGHDFEGDVIQPTSPSSRRAAIHVAEAVAKAWRRDSVLSWSREGCWEQLSAQASAGAGQQGGTEFSGPRCVRPTPTFSGSCIHM